MLISHDHRYFQTHFIPEAFLCRLSNDGVWSKPIFYFHYKTRNESGSSVWWAVLMKSTSQTGWVNFHLQAPLVFQSCESKLFGSCAGEMEGLQDQRLDFQCNYFMPHCTKGIQISLRLFLSLDANYPFLQLREYENIE